MLQEIINSCAPSDWNTDLNHFRKDYKLIQIPHYSDEFKFWNNKVRGNFNLGVTAIFRLENPYLYAQYLLKMEEYNIMGPYKVIELFHDTSRANITSIVSGNLNWRKAKRVKFGQGVSFSPSPVYANSKSSKTNGANRVMIVADVLVGKTQIVYESVQLPSQGFDTTRDARGKVYVKYDDNEYYPKIIIYYNSS